MRGFLGGLVTVVVSLKVICGLVDWYTWLEVDA